MTSEDSPQVTFSARRVAELVAQVSDEVVRQLEEEAKPRPPASRARKAPEPYVDLARFPPEMSDRLIARELGVRKPDVSFYTAAIKQERSGLNDRRVPAGRTRCQAGRRSVLFLRCQKAALPGERWCADHHPTPPVPTESPAQRDRLRRDQLWGRADGRVLEAIYEQSDWLERLADEQRQIHATLRKIEDALTRIPQEPPAPQPWLDIAAVQAHTGRSRATIYRAVRARTLAASRTGRAFAFRLSDVDQWMTGARTGRTNRRP